MRQKHRILAPRLQAAEAEQRSGVDRSADFHPPTDLRGELADLFDYCDSLNAICQLVRKVERAAEHSSNSTYAGDIKYLIISLKKIFFSNNLTLLLSHKISQKISNKKVNKACTFKDI